MRFKIIIINLFLIFLILEIGLRISGNYKTYSEKIGKGFTTYYNKKSPSWFLRNTPNASFMLDHGEFKFEYETNSLGYRERQPEWMNQNNIRLATFGDSHTDGVGAERAESWPSRLIVELQQSKPDAELLNFGISGSDPFYEFIEFKETVADLSPSHVIFMTNHTDLEDYIYRGGMERFKSDSTIQNRRGPWFLPIYRFSFISRVIIHQFGGYNQHFIKPEDMDGEFLQARDAIVECFDRVEAICKQKDIELMVVFMPMVGFACANKDNQQTIMEEMFNGDYSFKHIDLSNDFRNYFMDVEDCREEQYFWLMDGHFNAKGYGILAQLLYEAIELEYPNFWSITESNTSDNL